MPMREGLHGDFLCLHKVQRASGSVEVSWFDYAHWLFRLLSQHYLSNTVVSAFFQVRVILKTLASLIGPPRTL